MKKIPVKKSVFIELAKIASCDVVMSTHDGYYKQIDGLAMGSPPAPHLANGWMSKFDRQIEGNAKLFTGYMDDIKVMKSIENWQKSTISIQISHSP